MTPQQVYENVLITREHLLEAGFSRDVIEVAVSALLVETLPADHKTRAFMPRFAAAVLQARPGALQRHLARELRARHHETERAPAGLCEVTANEGSRLAIVSVPDDLERGLLGLR